MPFIGDENMMCDFDKTFRTTPEEIKRQIQCLRTMLTMNKSCCVCDNSESKIDTEMGYLTAYTWCKIRNEVRDYECGTNCPLWKAKFPEDEEKMNERLDRE